MSDFNPYAAPQSDILADPKHLDDGEGLWQDGSRLVIRKGAELPDRCLKCNLPAEGYRLKRTLSWHRPGWYLLVLISPIIYIIAALCVRWTAKVSAGLCPRHRSARRRAIAIGWLLALMGIALIVFGLSDPSHIYAFFVGLVAFLGGMIYGIIASKVMDPQRIDKNFVWLKKVSPAYLAALPEWQS